MTNGVEYLLGLDIPPVGAAREGSQATIYDWSLGNSFQVILIALTQSPAYSYAHIRAITTNGYGSANLANSRLRYQLQSGESDTRGIISIATLNSSAEV